MELLDELLAERDIRKLQALYTHHADDHRNADWAATFAENGALQVSTQRIVGRADLAAWLEKVQSGPQMRHLMLNSAITIESPTQARGTMDMVLLRAEGTGWVVLASPRYADRYEKTADGWKFAERIAGAPGK